MSDLGVFNDVNGVYERFLDAVPPARVVVQVAALPRGAQIAIDAVVIL